MSTKKNIPAAINSGTMRGTNIRLHVLDDAEHTPVMVFSDFLGHATNSRRRSLRKFFGAKCLEGRLNLDKVLREYTIQFRIPGKPQVFKGLTAEGWNHIARSLIEANKDGVLPSERLRSTAASCATILAACADVGMKAMMRLDAGYQGDATSAQDIDRAVEQKVVELRTIPGGGVRPPRVLLQHRMAWKDFLMQYRMAQKMPPGLRAPFIRLALQGFEDITGKNVADEVLKSLNVDRPDRSQKKMPFTVAEEAAEHFRRVIGTFPEDQQRDLLHFLSKQAGKGAESAS